MDSNEALVTQLPGGGQGSPQLGGMVRIIVHHHGAVALAVDLKAAACALEACGSGSALLHRQADKAADSAHGQCVVDVVTARHSQTDVAGDLAPLLEVELKEAGLVLLHIDGLIIAVVVDAEGADTAVEGIHNVHGVLVVGVGEDHELGHQGKALEGKLQLTHAAVVIQMVVVDVQHHRQVGGQFQEGLGELASLDDDIIALACLAVAADEGQLAADDRRGVTACQLQRRSDHGGGSGLAVGAGNADALLVQAAHVAQQNAALHRSDAVGSCRIQLHVILGNGRRIDHQICTDDIIRIVSQRDLDTHLTLGADDAAVQHIAARDLVALGRQDLDEGVHSASAAADEVDLLHIIQQMLGIIGVHEHIRQPPISTNGCWADRIHSSDFYYYIIFGA